MSPCGHVVDIETPSSDCAAFTLYVYSNMSAEIHNNMHTDKCMAECFDWKGSSLAFTSDELQVHNACTAAATCHSFQTVPTKTHNTRQVNHEIDGKWTTIQWTEFISQIILHAPFVSFVFYQMCIEASLLSPLSPPESMLMRLCFGICEINSAKSSISSQSSATPIQHWFWGGGGVYAQSDITLTEIFAK